MGTLAASGAYWISADADRIWASPTTLTGSIGIFGAIPTFENSLSEIGVYSDGIGTTSLSAGLNVTQPLPPALKETIQLTVDNGYNRFIDIVATGREMKKEDVELIAQGRIFSGRLAKENGLVDELGHLGDAIEDAASLAGLTEYSPVYIFTEDSLKNLFLQRFTEVNTGSLFHLLAQRWFPQIITAEQMAGHFPGLQLRDDPKGLYAHSLIQFSM